MVFTRLHGRPASAAPPRVGPLLAPQHRPGEILALVRVAQVIVQRVVVDTLVLLSLALPISTEADQVVLPEILEALRRLRGQVCLQCRTGDQQSLHQKWKIRDTGRRGGQDRLPQGGRVQLL